MSLTRLSCFSLIGAIETDLRSVIVEAMRVAGVDSFLVESMRENARRRRESDQGSGSDGCPDAALIDYLDFGDLGQLLGMHSRLMPQYISEASSLIEDLQGLVVIRNRVCHSRPLEVDDYQTLFDFADGVAKSIPAAWRDLHHALSTLRASPTALLRLSIPDFWRDEERDVLNNLPPTDFDDTGFIGRQKDVENIKKLILGPYPVISVIGEGGVGKTATTLKALYELLESDVSKRFDALAWVSLKSAVLTASGITDVRGAIRDTLGMYGAIAESLGGAVRPASDGDALLAEVREYMSGFRVLLVIDNLESLPQEEIIAFLRDIPMGSKVLITSRVGLGQLEHPFPLAPLGLDDSVRMLRLAARAQNQLSLLKAKPEVVSRWCQRLLNNPLAIKWFVASVALGKSPEALLHAEGADFRRLLEFSFQDLYESLPRLAQQVATVAHLSGRAVSKAEICGLVDASLGVTEPDHVEAALRTLVNASVMQRMMSTRDAGVTQYLLNPFPREFLRFVVRPSKEMTGKVNRALQQQKDAVERAQRRRVQYSYDVVAVYGESNDENIVAAQLLRALELARDRQYGDAQKIVERTMRTTPGSSEVRRIAAMVAAKAGDYVAATDHFEAACEIRPHSAIARYTYARMLLYDLQDHDGALKQVEHLLALRPDDTPVRALHAFVLSRLGRFAESARLYDELIVQSEGALPQHRIAMIDQAIETYRRWAENDSRVGDVSGFHVRIRRAIELGRQLRGSLGRGLDAQCRQKLFETFVLLVADACRRRDVAFAEQAFDEFRDVFVGVFGYEAWSMSDSAVIDCFSRSRHRDLIEAVLGARLTRTESVESRAGARSRRLMGRVKLLASVGSYGFLTTDEGASWFFHRNAFSPRESFDRLGIGASVSFDIGSNAQGPCAVNCRVEAAQ